MVVESRISDFITVTSGVLQGSRLGSVLFDKHIYNLSGNVADVIGKLAGDRHQNLWRLFASTFCRSRWLNCETA